MREASERPLLVAALAAVAFAAVVAPVLAPFALSGHSAALDALRAEAWQRASAAGAWLPRWLPDLYGGYGSPIFVFYAPLPYVLEGFVRHAGAGPVAAHQLALVALLAGGALGARALARPRFGEAAGWIACGLWILSPYLLLDLFVRSAFGEIAGLALLPWALAGVLATDSGPLARRVAAGAAGVALLVAAHNVVALLAAPALVAAVLVAPDAERRGRRAAALAAGLALAATFWLPALGEKHLVHAEESLTSGPLAVAGNLLDPGALLPWRAQLDFPAHQGERFPFRFGAALWLATLALPFSIARSRGPGRAATLGSAATLAAVALTITRLAAPLWEVAPLARYVQFPYRLLGPASLAAALAGAAVVAASARRWRIPAALALLALAGVSAAPLVGLARYGLVDPATLELAVYPRSQIAAARAEARRAEPAEIAAAALDARLFYSGTLGDEYLPRTVAVRPAPVATAVAVVAREPEGGVTILRETRRGTRLEVEVDVTRPARLVLHQFYFPGWRGRVDGRARAVSAEPQFGRIEIALEPGDRRVEVEFGATLLRSAAHATSLATAAGLVLWAGTEAWRRRSAGAMLRSPVPR